MLAFEAELAHLPRSLITALWEAIGLLRTDAKRQRRHSASVASSVAPHLQSALNLSTTLVSVPLALTVI
jgi:hypothetical protein